MEKLDEVVLCSWLYNLAYLGSLGTFASESGKRGLPAEINPRYQQNLVG